MYAGPQIRVNDEPESCADAGEGENMSMSGMYPPLDTPNLISASDISQDEKSERLEDICVESSRMCIIQR